MAGRVSVLAAEAHHAPMLAEFFRLTWDPSATVERVLAGQATAAAANASEPGVVPPTFIAVQDDRVIGYCSSLPLTLWKQGQPHAAYWAKGLMVLPEFRSGPIGYHVLAALTKSRPLLAAVTVAEGSKRLFGALGYRDVGAIPNLVRATRYRMALSQIRPMALPLGSSGLKRVALRSAEFARRAGLAYAGGLLADGVSGLLYRSGRAHGEVRLHDVLDTTELDTLWQQVQGEVPAMPARDGRTWSQRYFADGATMYRRVTLRRQGRLVGMALVKVPRVKGDPRLAGLRMASISDLLISPCDPGVGALLQAAEDAAAHMGAGSVILSVTDRRLVAAARQRGYLQRPGNIHFFLRDTNRDSAWPEPLGDWWLTRGDGESDATF